MTSQPMSYDPVADALLEIGRIDKGKDFYAGLKKYITDAQNQLPDNQQLSVYYHTPSDDITVGLLSYRGNDLIVIDGLDSQGNLCAVCLHVSSLQLIFRIRNLEEKEEKREIGFHGIYKD